MWVISARWCFNYYSCGHVSLAELPHFGNISCFTSPHAYLSGLLPPAHTHNSLQLMCIYNVTYCNGGCTGTLQCSNSTTMWSSYLGKKSQWNVVVRIFICLSWLLWLLTVFGGISYQKYEKCMPTSYLIDINECEVDFDGGSGNGSIMSGSGDSLGPCGPNQTCINLFGGFFCTCPPGFFSTIGGECIGKSLQYPREVRKIP